MPPSFLLKKRRFDNKVDLKCGVTHLTVGGGGSEDMTMGYIDEVKGTNSPLGYYKASYCLTGKQMLEKEKREKRRRTRKRRQREQERERKGGEEEKEAKRTRERKRERAREKGKIKKEKRCTDGGDMITSTSLTR